MIVLQEEIIQKMQNVKNADMKELYFGREGDNKDNNDSNDEDTVVGDIGAAFAADYDDDDDDSNNNDNEVQAQPVQVQVLRRDDDNKVTHNTTQDKR
mmetsp:Transcript_33635/g.37811  ORF Transcript_33635/g.37811 Transcript_33635/m.37811 type:complete len:97 (+) Transcript_33635:934-1224(+)